MKINLSEIDKRLERFRKCMDSTYPHWDTVIIVSKVNQYYFTGTMQDGFIVIKKNGSEIYYVYKSYERAREESSFRDIVPISSYRDASIHSGKDCKNTFFETEVVPYGMIERFKKYFSFQQIYPVDKTILSVRSVKSDFEIELMKKIGELHNAFMVNIVPYLFHDNMSEAQLFAEVYEKMLKHGSQGMTRFQGFQEEMLIGQTAFGESSIYPNNLNSPDGSYGLSPGIPLIGSRERKLKKGDLIFVDLGYGIDGYHTDKTQVFIFKEKPGLDVIKNHNKCKEILEQEKSLLKPGAIPSEIHTKISEKIKNESIENFMGYGAKTVRFLGHGVGLNIDELPVIAQRFDEKLEKNMVVALEPKIGIKGIGLVGIEETYVICENGPVCITGGAKDIIEI